MADDDDPEFIAMLASYGGGLIDDPEAIARGRARILELIEEGVNSGPATPFVRGEAAALARARMKRAA